MKSVLGRCNQAWIFCDQSLFFGWRDYWRVVVAVSAGQYGLHDRIRRRILLRGYRIYGTFIATLLVVLFCFFSSSLILLFNFLLDLRSFPNLFQFLLEVRFQLCFILAKVSTVYAMAPSVLVLTNFPRYFYTTFFFPSINFGTWAGFRD